jgi:hypothetical protein
MMVALLKANASKHKAMSYDRMEKAEREFADVVKGWLDQAEITDLGEDARFRNRQGDELPAWVANKVERQKKIREAKAALEKEAAEKAKADKKDDDVDPPEPPKVDPKAQRNFTDPESRIMPTKQGHRLRNKGASESHFWPFGSRWKPPESAFL